jgi:hypothetical protein
MAHFAELDVNNNVLRVIVVSNNDIKDENGNESEAIGVAFCEGLKISETTTWKQCSYNKTFRLNYPGPGWIYDPVLDVFHAPKPFPSWTLNMTTGVWQAPVARPDNNDADVRFEWDETNQAWIRYNKVGEEWVRA